MNVVMTGDGAFVEVQGTAEGAPFDRAELDALLDLAREGLRRPHRASSSEALARMTGSSSPRATPRSSTSCSGSSPSRARHRGARARRRRRRTTSRPRPSRRSRATRCSRRAPGSRRPGLPSLADDSGLCVDALNGMPGVLSARWAGPPPRDDAAQQRAAARPARRRTRRAPRRRTSRCAVALLPCPAVRERVVARRDARSDDPRAAGRAGASATTSLFVADEHADAGLTSAELQPARRTRISHRGRALRELAPYVAADLSAA